MAGYSDAPRPQRPVSRQRTGSSNNAEVREKESFLGFVHIQYSRVPRALTMIFDLKVPVQLFVFQLAVSMMEES